jgi:hypothetical protein
VDEWGPYDFRSPSVWLRNIEGDIYTFLLMGPKEGNWKAIKGEGWAQVNQYTGNFPATLICTKKPGADYLTLNFEYIGEAFTDRFGHFHKKGEVFPFKFSRFERQLAWKVSFFHYDEASDPILHFDVFDDLRKKTPLHSELKKDLWYAWWGNPAAGVREDKFATLAEVTFDAEPGAYRIRITSDDGMKFYIDDWLRLSNWDVHEPETEEIEVTLKGRHTFRIWHFDAGGFGTLDFKMEPIR